MQQNCQNCKKQFEIDSEDQSFYQKINVPNPTWCPDCRLMRRLSWRNERSLHKRVCNFSGDTIVSLYPEDTPFPVYHMKYWWGDDWDQLEYGQEIDWSTPFLEQIQQLRRRVPRVNLIGLYTTHENSEYVNMAHNCKNCYLLFNSDYNENCAFGSEIESCTDCLDNLMIDNCTLCYECINCYKCYQTYYSEDCSDCRNVWMSKDCVGCTDCFGCVNLRKQQYHIFNKPYTKEDYFAELEKMNLKSRQSLRELQKQAEDLWVTEGKFKYMHGTNNDTVSGDYVYNSKNVKDTFIARDSRDCRYCMWLIVGDNEDCYDYTQFGEKNERIYEVCLGGAQAQDNKFCYLAVTGSGLEYCDSMYGSSNCFGCVGLRKKEYCILNKQYTKEEYEALVPKIKEHMKDMPYKNSSGHIYSYGEFFPPEFSFFPYNQSSAQDFFPKTESDVQSAGLVWKEIAKGNHTITLKNADIPDVIDGVGNEILQEIIECGETGQPFRIVQSELDLCRQLGVPLPHVSPDERQKRRAGRRNPPKYHKRTTEDGKDVLTAYAPDRPEKIYSEEGYQEEVL